MLPPFSAAPVRHSPPGVHCCSRLHRLRGCHFRVVFALSQALPWPLEALVSLCIRHLQSCVIPTGIWNSAHPKLKPASSPSHPFRCSLSLRWRSASSSGCGEFSWTCPAASCFVSAPSPRAACSPSSTSLLCPSLCLLCLLLRVDPQHFSPDYCYGLLSFRLDSSVDS